jgi:hypothetical protein
MDLRLLLVRSATCQKADGVNMNKKKKRDVSLKKSVEGVGKKNTFSPFLCHKATGIYILCSPSPFISRLILFYSFHNKLETHYE